MKAEHQPKQEQPVDSLKLREQQAIVDGLRDGLAIVHNGEVIIHNRSLEKLLDFASDEVNLDNLVARLSLTENATARSCVQRLRSHLQLGPIQFDITLPSGEARTVELLTRVINLPGVSALQIMLTDLTREYEIAMELFDTLTLLNSVFDAIEEAIFILDEKDLTLRSSNIATTKRLKIDRAAYKGQTLWNLFGDPQDAHRFIADIRQELPKSRTLHFNFEMRRGDGVLIPAMHTVTGVRDSKGQTLAIMWVISDMSQRVFMKRALAEVENRYRILFDRGGDATFIIDNESLQIIDANQAAEEQLGYTRAELIGRTVFDITPSSRHAQLKADIALVSLKAASSTLHGINLAKDGHEIPVQTSMVATSFGGRKVIISACRDISEQIEREAERVRLEKLEAVRQITGGIAHEVSQPLQGLVTIADLLDSPETPVEMQRSLAEKIPDLVTRIADLLNKMKGIVRLATRPYVQRNDILDFDLSTMRPRMIVIESSQELDAMVTKVATAQGIEVFSTDSLTEAQLLLAKGDFDILMCCNPCNTKEGADFLSKVNRQWPHLAVIKLPDNDKKSSLTVESELIRLLNDNFFSKWD